MNGRISGCSRFRLYLAVVLLLPFARVDAQELRTWTASSGHTLEAKLVWWSDYEVALIGKDGAERTVDVDDFTLADQEYLKTQESLKKNAPPKKLPWVNVSARTQMQGRKIRYGVTSRYDIRKKSYFLDIESKHDEALEIELVYTYYGERLSGGAGGIRKVDEYDLYPFDGKIEKLTIPAFGEIEMVTDTGRATEARTHRWWGGYQTGSNITGLVVQVYWNGFLLNGFATDSQLQARAQDGELMKKLEVATADY